MEVEKITVKVELDGVSIEAVAVLTNGEGASKEEAAGAAGALSAELRAALQDGVDARAPVGAGYVNGGQESHAERFPVDPRTTRAPQGPKPMSEHFCFPHDQDYTRQQNARGVWWSHRIADSQGGGWCREGR